MDTIVVQETDRDVLDVLYTAMEIGGFNVFALSALDDDFLELIDKARPHVVVLDYVLSGEQCIFICREIKRKYPQLPVLALSCNSNIHDLYRKNGFDGYIEKPFDLDKLYEILHRHIPKHTQARP